MISISNMKVGAKLAVGFGTLALMTVILSVFALSRMQQIADVVHMQNAIRTERLERLYVAREALDQTGIAARNAFIFSDEAQARTELDLVDRQKAIYLDALEAMTPLFRDNPEFDRVRTGLIAMAGELSRPRQFRETGRMREYGEFLVNECSPLRRQIVADIELLIKSEQRHVDAISREAEHILDRSLEVVPIVSGIALLLCIATGVLLTRGLLRQLGGEPAEVRAIANRIAEGDLTVEVVTRADDRSSVMQAMKQMRESLLRIVSDVRAGTDTIADASRRIAVGNRELSSRTEQQAASLEETASFVEELTATVRQNADHARHADRLAQSTSDIAFKGGEAVSQVVETMASISASSRRVADIISVIDRIAFQTNILALNATVEAARAGERGKGFAVVAAEVRDLAQRSAVAAKEIEGLIGDALEKVGAGTAQVDRAGATMKDIVASVGQVTGIMSQITAASREQAAGIAHIGQTISQLDHATQQNASMGEEVADASGAMQDQAGWLAQLVSVFKTDGAATDGAASGAVAQGWR